jgi:hypothetical protein
MSFERTGLYPWNPDKHLCNPRIHPSTEVTINNRERKTLQMDNQIITTESMIQKIDEEKARAKKRKNDKNGYVPIS